MTGAGMLPRIVGRSDAGKFTVGLTWTFHSAGRFNLLDPNACPSGQGMLCCEMPPWTLVFLDAINAKKKLHCANM